MRGPAHVRATVVAAREARAEAGLAAADPVDDILRLSEDALGLPVLVARIGGGIAGAYARLGNDRLALVAGDEAAVRRRFTLAHELGHHRLGHASSMDTERSLRDTYDPVEASANRFAAELLAPPEAVERLLDELDDREPTLELVVRLAHHFGISARAARIRLETVGVLTDRERIARLDGEILDERLHGALAAALGLGPPGDELSVLTAGDLPRLPAVASRSVLAARLAGTIGDEEAAAALGADPDAVAAALRP